MEVPFFVGCIGTCMLGGNIATNVGGKLMRKYGPMRSNLIGLQVVLPTGEILNL